VLALVEKIAISLKEEEHLKIPESNQGQCGPTPEKRDEHCLNIHVEERGDSPRRSRSQILAERPCIRPISLSSAGQILGSRHQGRSGAVLPSPTDPFS
jgi:hypothetical protein